MRTIHNLFSRVYRKKDSREFFMLGILGSPRPKGNCAYLLERALAAARQNGAVTETIVLNTLRFRGCQACTQTRDDGRCAVEDDFQHIYDRVCAADGIVLATPVYFGSVSAQTKTMIDRFQCHWQARANKTCALPEKDRTAGFICVQAGQRQDFFDTAESVARNFFATVGARYGARVLLGGAEDPAAAAADRAACDEAAALGGRLMTAAADAV